MPGKRPFAVGIVVCLALSSTGASASGIVWRIPADDEPIFAEGETLLYRTPRESRWVSIETGGLLRRGPVTSHPAPNATVWVKLRSSGNVLVVDSKRQRLWEKVFRRPVTGPVSAANRILLQGPTHVVALRVGTGEEVWRYAPPESFSVAGLAVIDDGVVRIPLQHREYAVPSAVFVDLESGASRGELKQSVLHHVVKRGRIIALSSSTRTPDGKVRSHETFHDVEGGTIMCERVRSSSVAGHASIRDLHADGNLVLVHDSNGVLEAMDDSCKVRFRTAVAGSYSDVVRRKRRTLLIHTTGNEIVARDLAAIRKKKPTRHMIRGRVSAPEGAPPLLIRLGHDEADVKQGRYRIRTTLNGIAKIVAKGADDKQFCIGTAVVDLDKPKLQRDISVVCEPH